MVGTSTAELDCLLSKCLTGTSVHPLGVFAADKVPYDEAKRLLLLLHQKRNDSHRHRGVGFIVNSDKASRSGQHWVALLLLLSPSSSSSSREPLRCEFFDSYGLSPFSSTYHTISANLPTWITPSTTKYSNVCLQSLDSASCGHYCIMFLVSRARGIGFDRFITSLSRVSGGATARDRLVEGSVAKLRKLVPCLPTRCDGASNQCCVPQVCYHSL